jgi:type VI secretion system protein ImpA
MIDFESLLAPISDELPCGEDVVDTPEFVELESLLRGKAETQFSEAVGPDWKAIEEHTTALFGKSKNLEVAVMLVVAAVENHGLPAVADGIEFLAGLVRAYWADLYPRLDPDDDNDPLERINILANLTAPVGSYGDPYQFVQKLAELPLTNSPRLGSVTYAQAVSKEVTAPFEAALRDTPIEQNQATSALLVRSLAAVDALVAALVDACGTEKAPTLDILRAQIVAMSGLIDPHVAAATAPAPSGAVETETATVSVPGVIQSREDVIAALDRMCLYYSQAEPSSPVPLLLQRARRLVRADFFSILNELAPDAVSQARTTTGATAPAE